MPQDQFFTKSTCDRCHKSLNGQGFSARIMSWFTEETICMDCSTVERQVKTDLRAAGKPSMEACGFIPVKGTHY